MGTAVLVDSQVAAGKALIEALDRRGFPVRSALWFYVDEHDVWKLVIESPLVDELSWQECFARYDAVFSELPDLPFPIHETRLVGRNEPLVEALRKKIVTGPTALKAIRWRKSTIHDIFVDDVLIYRSN